jgi:hypothetical protein
MMQTKEKGNKGIESTDSLYLYAESAVYQIENSQTMKFLFF